MTRVVNVCFYEGGKSYKFICDGYSLRIGDAVMVETQFGMEIARVVQEPFEIEQSKLSEIIVPIIRKADDKEKERYELKLKKEKEAFEFCLPLIEKHKLKMKLVAARFSFDGKRITFYFTADNRVDFRELVKDLSYAFKARIELRQIGTRDKAKLIGGVGNCGRELCCCSFLNHFAQVNVKMAREQGISLNPSKLNGACGRLMCCIQYEKEAYDDARERLPQVGQSVRTPRGVGTVESVALLEEKVSVKFVTSDDLIEVENFVWGTLEPLNSKEKFGKKRNEKKNIECENNCDSCQKKADCFEDTVGEAFDIDEEK